MGKGDGHGGVAGVKGMNSQAEDYLTCRVAGLLVSVYQSRGGNLKGLMKTKVFLRCRGTGQYYAWANVWSDNTSVAHEFDTVEGAAMVARIRGLAGMEVVVHEDDPPCDLVLPLRQPA
jgi:hypothetical protein